MQTPQQIQTPQHKRRNTLKSHNTTKSHNTPKKSHNTPKKASIFRRTDQAASEEEELQRETNNDKTINYFYLRFQLLRSFTFCCCCRICICCGVCVCCDPFSASIEMKA
ncbi:hypothetical protein NL108_012683 [Boleophthalmus pectinirostris]|nr:hypothetical protein NL108_012683 [Boleophthalmus pectinirostris]